MAHRPDVDSAADSLAEGMREAGVEWALAVGMGPEIGGYEEDSYASWVAASIPGAIPIAFPAADRLRGGTADADYVERLLSLGYRGIKIHPRLHDLEPDDERVARLVALAGDAGLLTLLCTYGRGGVPMSLDSVHALLSSAPESPIVLLHGGLSRALEWSEVVRSFPHALLDLSFTMARYEGSSFSADVDWLFRNFDRRLCVGSDHPEGSPASLRRLFERHADGLDPARRSRIANGNLRRLLGEVPDHSAGSGAGA